mgnify:FL=1
MELPPQQHTHTLFSQKEKLNLASVENNVTVDSSSLPNISSNERIEHDDNVLFGFKEKIKEELSSQEDNVTLKTDNGHISADCEMKDVVNTTVKVEGCETRVGLNAKVSENSLNNTAPTPWHASIEMGVRKEETEDVSMPLDAGTLPLDSEGKLDFFLIYAYEEAFGANPGTLFLFGKVKFFFL